LAALLRLFEIIVGCSIGKTKGIFWATETVLEALFKKTYETCQKT